MVIAIISQPKEFIIENAIENEATPKQVEQFVRQTARSYGIDVYLFTETARCESGFDVKAYNPRDTDGKPAVGLFQFKEATFNLYKNKYDVKDFDINNWKHQTYLAAMMWQKGIEINHWGCFIKIAKANY